MKKARKPLSLILIIVMILSIIVISPSTASAAVSSRNDGNWFFPLPQNYYKSFTDWAGCNASPGATGACPFHGRSCLIGCGAYHKLSNGMGHNGIDIGCPANTNVYASSNGTIVYAGALSARGNTIIMEHKIANTNYSYYSIYQHLASFVKSSGSANAGDLIAKSGNSGGNYGYHLHFSIIRGESGLGTNCFKYDSYGSSAKWLTGNGEVGQIVTNPKPGNTNLSSVNQHAGSVTYVFSANQATFWGEPAGNNPIGGIDGVSSPSLGKITVIGWAYDPDDTTAQIDVHIYVGGPAGSGEKHIVKANTYQKSVDDTYHCGLYHGFFATFDTKKSGNQPIYAYGINIGGGTTNSQLYGVPRTVYINSDTEKPKVSDITVSQISSNGYRVTCRVSDNVGVTSVKFPSWEQHVGASDVKWHEGTLSGDNKIGSCYIPLNEHNNVKGDYITHIYPYDSSGNYCSVSAGNINITDEPLLVYSTEYNGNIYKVFNSGKTWTQAKEWCEKQGGHLATISNSSEWNTVKQALEKYNGVPCWLGAESTSGTWKWVTGENLTYTNWSSGQPDCAGKNEFYLGTFSDSKKWLDCYLWNDYSNDGASRVGGFVCEFEKIIQNSSTTTNPTKPTTTETKPTITETIATTPTVPTTSPITTNPTQTKPTATSPITTKPTESKTTVTLAKYSASIYVKGTAIFRPTVKNGKGVTTYKSNNTRVAKVDSGGKLTALKAGTAKITITNNKVSKVFTVKVLNPKLNKTSVSISRGKSYTLKITGKIGKAKFYTSNKKIATVNSKGKIKVNKKAKKGKTVIIKVKTNGITLKCKVKVK